MYGQTMFALEDEQHAEPQGEFASRGEALDELRRRAAIRWDESPNACPCLSWRTCRRLYEIIEYDTSVMPWMAITRTSVLEISATGVRWFGASDLVGA